MEVKSGHEPHNGEDQGMAQFMLLVRGGDEGTRDYTPEQFQQMMQMYFDWSDKLRREGRNLGANELREGGKTVRTRGSETYIDGPYVESKEAVGGYFMIEAKDMDEAAEIARGCPVLTHGGIVEVREIVTNR
jgi:hypothetical protein